MHCPSDEGHGAKALRPGTGFTRTITSESLLVKQFYYNMYKPNPISAASSDQLLTIDEAAKLLSVSKMTLYRWDLNGILKKVEIGGKRRYRKSDIDRLAGCKM